MLLKILSRRIDSKNGAGNSHKVRRTERNYLRDIRSRLIYQSFVNALERVDLKTMLGLIQHIKLDAVDGKGNTLLHRMARMGKTVSVRFLFNHGCPVDKLNNDGHSCLDLAVIHDHEAVARALCNCIERRINKEGLDPESISTVSTDDSTTKVLVQLYDSMREVRKDEYLDSGWYPSVDWDSWGDYGEQEKKADPLVVMRNRRRPFQLAVELNRPLLLKVLCEAFPDIYKQMEANSDGLLFLAVDHNSISCAELLVREFGFDPMRQRSGLILNALDYAAFLGRKRKEMVDSLFPLCMRRGPARSLPTPFFEGVFESDNGMQGPMRPSFVYRYHLGMLQKSFSVTQYTEDYLRLFKEQVERILKPEIEKYCPELGFWDRISTLLDSLTHAVPESFDDFKKQLPRKYLVTLDMHSIIISVGSQTEFGHKVAFTNTGYLLRQYHRNFGNKYELKLNGTFGAGTPLRLLHKMMKGQVLTDTEFLGVIEPGRKVPTKMTLPGKCYNEQRGRNCTYKVLLSELKIFLDDIVYGANLPDVVSRLLFLKFRLGQSLEAVSDFQACTTNARTDSYRELYQSWLQVAAAKRDKLTAKISHLEHTKFKLRT